MVNDWSIRMTDAQIITQKIDLLGLVQDLQQIWYSENMQNSALGLLC